MTQNQPYRLLKRHGEFELRDYPAGMQIETEVSGDFINAGSIGFRPLVNFISGNNRARQAIAMTAPVIQESVTTSRHKVRFVMPEEMDESNTPSPSDSKVSVVRVPAHLAAARKFGGSWNKEKFEREGTKLLEEVTQAGLVRKWELKLLSCSFACITLAVHKWQQVILSTLAEKVFRFCLLELTLEHKSTQWQWQ
jgi:hypothetical protein